MKSGLRSPPSCTDSTRTAPHLITRSCPPLFLSPPSRRHSAARRPPAAGRPFSSVGYRHPSRLFLHLHQSSSPATISLFLLQIWMEPPPLFCTGRGCSRRCRRWWLRAGQAGFPTVAAHVALARIGDGVQPLQSQRPTATARGLPCTGVGENPPTPLPFPAAPSAQAGSPRPLTRSTFFEPYCVFSARLAGVRRNASKTT